MTLAEIWESRDKRDNGRRVRVVRGHGLGGKRLLVENLDGTKRRVIRIDVLRRTYRPVGP